VQRATPSRGGSLEAVAVAPSVVFKLAFLVISAVLATKFLFANGVWQWGAELRGRSAMIIIGFVIRPYSSLIGVGGGALSNLVLTSHGRSMHVPIGVSAGAGSSYRPLEPSAMPSPVSRRFRRSQSALCPWCRAHGARCHIGRALRRTVGARAFQASARDDFRSLSDCCRCSLRGQSILNNRWLHNNRLAMFVQ
jgi:hypothetical protein